MDLRLTIVVDANDWDSGICGWRMPILQVPGAQVEAVFIDGGKADDAKYTVDSNLQMVRWVLPEHPARATVCVTLSQDLSPKTDLDKYRADEARYKSSAEKWRLITVVFGAVAAAMPVLTLAIRPLFGDEAAKGDHGRATVQPVAGVPKKVLLGFTPYGFQVNKEFEERQHAYYAKPANAYLEKRQDSSVRFSVLVEDVATPYEALLDVTKNPDLVLQFLSPLTYIRLRNGLVSGKSLSDFETIGRLILDNDSVYQSAFLVPKSCKAVVSEKDVRVENAKKFSIAMGQEKLSASTRRVPITFLVERGIAFGGGRQGHRDDLRGYLREAVAGGECLLAPLSTSDVHELSSDEIEQLSVIPIDMDIPLDALVVDKKRWEALDVKVRDTIVGALAGTAKIKIEDDSARVADSVFEDYVGSGVARKTGGKWLVRFPEPDADVLNVRQLWSQPRTRVRLVRFPKKPVSSGFAYQEYEVGRGELETQRAPDGYDAVLVTKYKGPDEFVHVLPASD